MYIFYRFENFAEMETKNFINAEEKCLLFNLFIFIILKVSGPTLGCYYSSMGLNRELND